MTRNEQVSFVFQLSNGIVKELTRDIVKGKIPNEWDGHELRQLLADRCARATVRMEGKQKREYRNTVLVNDL